MVFSRIFDLLVNDLLYLFGGMRGGTMADLPHPLAGEIQQATELERRRAQEYARACERAWALHHKADGDG